MIDSAQLRRLIEQICPTQLSANPDTLKLAQVIYRAGMEDMRGLAMGACIGQRNVYDAVTEIRSLEIES